MNKNSFALLVAVVTVVAFSAGLVLSERPAETAGIEGDHYRFVPG